MKYDHQAFQVSDIDSSIDFYVNKLGFRLCSKETDNNILEFIQRYNKK
jgi:catechol 2,3-dioxygenase-like lactoylglutathione lyase family enzyme